MRHLDSRYGTNPAIVPGAIQKNTNDPSTAPTVLVTLLLPHHASVFTERRASPAGQQRRKAALLSRSGGCACSAAVVFITTPLINIDATAGSAHGAQDWGSHSRPGRV